MASPRTPAMAEGPKEWDDSELRDNQAIDFQDGELWPLSTLTNTPHTIFDRKRWRNHEGNQLSNADYETLLPSIKLASRFLEVGIDYLANFLPSDKIYDGFDKSKLDINDSLDAEEGYNDLYTIPIKEKGTYDDAEVEVARKELTDIAETLTWRLNRSLYAEFTFMGITRLVPPPSDPNEPWNEPSKDEVDGADEEAQDEGKNRRPLTVGIMQEYLDNLKKYAKGQNAAYARSELLRTTFLCGYTMAHEIAHVVWSQDWRSLGYNEMGLEPFCGDDAQSELGHCFMSWIFGGFDPNLSDLGDNRSVDFSQHLVWHYQPKKNERWPRYRKTWAISLPYMSSLFEDNTWTITGDINTQQGRLWIMEELRPDINRLAWCARAMSKAAYQRNRNPDRRQLMEERMEDDVSDMNIDNDDFGGGFLLWGVGEDDEEQFAPPDFQFPTELDKLPDFLPVREPLDSVGLGAVWQDVPDEELTMLEVKYRPRVTQSAATKLPPGRSNFKRTRYIQIDDEDNGEFAAANEDSEERFGNEQYDCRDVSAVLENKSVEAVANFTHRGAYNYALTHDISCWKRWDARVNTAWGDSKLNLLDPGDRNFIEMIRQFSFNQAEKRFKDDDIALNEIKQARLESIFDWTDREDLVEIARGLGLRPKAKDSTETIRMNIYEAYEREGRTVKANAERRIASGEMAPRSDTFQEKLNGVKDWKAEEFQEYERSKGIPDWGTFATRIKRVQRKMIEDREGPVDRYRANQDSKGPVQRTNQGVESYVFALIPQQTTVLDVKGWLFDAGVFPANSIMHLCLGKDRRGEMQDDNFLDAYEPTDWRDVWLYIELKYPLQPPPAQRRPTVYNPRNSLPGSGGGQSKKRKADDADEPQYYIENGKKYRKIDDDLSEMQEGGYRIDVDGTVFQVLSENTLMEDKDFKRQRKLLGKRPDGGTKDPIDPLPLEDRTDYELVNDVAAGQESLKKGFQKGGGVTNPLKQGAAKSQKAKDILEIADSLDDIDEAEEARSKAVWDIEDAMKKNDDDGRILGYRPVAEGDFVVEGFDDPFAPTSGKDSAMQELYKVISKNSREGAEDDE